MISDATAPLALFIMGSPGSGKSTLSELLAERLRMVEVRSGDILRNLAADPKADRELARTVVTHLSVGRPMPMEVYLAAVRSYLSATNDHKSTGVIFEGFPRTVTQCTSIPRALEVIDLPTARVVGLHLTASAEECAARINSRVICLTCGRSITEGRGCCSNPAPGRRSDDLNPHARLKEDAPLASRVTDHFVRKWPVIMIRASRSPQTVAGEAVNHLRELGLNGRPAQRPSEPAT